MVDFLSVAVCFQEFPWEHVVPVQLARAVQRADRARIKRIPCHPVDWRPLHGDRGDGASEAFLANPLQWLRKLFSGWQRMFGVVEYHRRFIVTPCVLDLRQAFVAGL